MYYPLLQEGWVRWRQACILSHQEKECLTILSHLKLKNAIRRLHDHVVMRRKEEQLEIQAEIGKKQQVISKLKNLAQDVRRRDEAKMIAREWSERWRISKALKKWIEITRSGGERGRVAESTGNRVDALLLRECFSQWLKAYREQEKWRLYMERCDIYKKHQGLLKLKRYAIDQSTKRELLQVVTLEGEKRLKERVVKEWRVWKEKRLISKEENEIASTIYVTSLVRKVLSQWREITEVKRQAKIARLRELEQRQEAAKLAKREALAGIVSLLSQQ